RMRGVPMHDPFWSADNFQDAAGVAGIREDGPERIAVVLQWWRAAAGDVDRAVSAARAYFPPGIRAHRGRRELFRDERRGVGTKARIDWKADDVFGSKAAAC